MFVQVQNFPCQICQSCTYPFINSDMTIASDVFLMICSILLCGSCESRSSSVKKSVNISAAEFISRSGLRLLIWSRRTSPGCWRTCSTHCLEGCTRDSWWRFAAGRRWKASWSHSIYSSVSLSWSSGLWGQKGRRAQQSMWVNSNLMNSLCDIRRNNVIRKEKEAAV